MNIIRRIRRYLTRPRIQTFELHLQSCASSIPDQVAIYNDLSGTISYRELYKITLQIREELFKSGVGNNSRVVVLMDKPIDFFLLSLAISGYAICIPIPATSSEYEINRTIFLSDANSIVFPNSLKVNVSDEILKIPYTINVENGFPEIPLSNGNLTPSGIIQRSSLSDVAYILQTTGSTAEPKLVPITHEAIIRSCIGSIDSLLLSSKDRCLNFMPLNHIHGLVSCMYTPLVAKSSTILTNGFNRNDFIEWLKKYNPTWFSTTPTFYREIVKLAKENKISLNNFNLRFIRTGSAPITTAFAAQLQKTFGVPLIQAYGMTETMQLTGNPIDRQKPGSVGKSIGGSLFAFSDKGEKCNFYETGNIMAKGKTIMKGYIKNEQANYESFQNGWFKTGDLGWFDEDGYLFLVGRTKEMINKGGEKIAPSEIEEIAIKFDGVEESVAFPVNSKVYGEEIGLALRMKDCDLFQEDIFRQFLSEYLSPVKIPGHFYPMNVFPITANGKIDKKRLQELCIEHSVTPKLNFEDKNINPVQQFVKNWFIKILEHNNINIKTDFFVAGGTSIGAADLVAGIGKQLDATIHGLSFLKYPTIEGYSNFLIEHYPDQLFKLTGENISNTLIKNTNRTLNIQDLTEFQKSLSVEKYPKEDLKKSIVSPVFILSCPRAGSTLLRTILAGNSNLFAPPELRLLNYSSLRDWKNNHSGEFTFFQEGLIRAIMQVYNTNAKESETIINQFIRNGYSTVKVYEEISTLLKNKRIVDKTPNYTLNIETLYFIEESFNSPKYLFLLRNPIDVKTSYENAHLEQIWMQDQPYKSGQLSELIWNVSYNNIESFLNNIPEDRQYKLYFEDLVTFPEQVVKNICMFLDIPFESNMLFPQSDQEMKMTNPAVKGSKMIGDPNFFKHKGIDSSVSKSGFYIPSTTKELSDFTMEKAWKLGYHNETSTSDSNGIFPQTFIEKQKILTKSWKGSKANQNAMIFGLNKSGNNIPIFWCFQSSEEHEILAHNLGDDYPLYGMRSGHLLFKNNESMFSGLAKLYAEEIIQLRPEGPYILGGNCQGANIIWHVTKEIEKRGKSVSALILMEVNIKSDYKNKLVLVYGKESKNHNPYLYEENPEYNWNKYYSNYSVELLEGNHGEYFTPNNNPQLASILKNVVNSVAID